MKILGIDPGLKATGYGIIDFGQNKITILEAGTIEPKKRDLLQNKIDKVYRNLNDLASEHKPEIMILEKLYAHYKHPTTACIMGHVRGVICLVCAQKKMKFMEYSVKRVRKALTGNGNATKLQTRSTVAYALRLKEDHIPLDASDALALALAHVHIAKASYL